MTKQEFERRVSLAIQHVESLLGGAGEDPTRPEAGGMSPAEALAFYEQVIELLDNRLEDMMGEWKEPDSSGIG